MGHSKRTLRRNSPRRNFVDPGARPTFSEVSAGVVEYLPHLKTFALSLTANKDQADDLVGEAVARALAAADQFHPGTNVKAWIFTILRNAFYSEGRKRKRAGAFNRASFSQRSADPTQDNLLAFCDFRRAFIQLPPCQQEVLMLVGNGDLTYEEVAEQCQCPVGTVKSRISRARLDLKRMLDEEAMAQPRRNMPAIASGDPAESLGESIKVHARRGPASKERPGSPKGDQ
jgi:RNA polymerase sigma-70 factor (ECF subfamily)